MTTDIKHVSPLDMCLFFSFEQQKTVAIATLAAVSPVHFPPHPGSLELRDVCEGMLHCPHLGPGNMVALRIFFYG